jgi:hypothetical protein
MALNTNPIYSGAGDIQWTPAAGLGTLNATYDGTSGTVVLVASASNSGSFIQRLRFKASGTTTSAVARIFINNGGSTSTLGNNVLFDEVSLPVQTASPTSATSLFEIPMNMALPAGYRIYATITASQSSGGWLVTSIGGSYAPIL